jgi:hypothetical protein
MSGVFVCICARGGSGGEWLSGEWLSGAFVLKGLTEHLGAAASSI